MVKIGKSSNFLAVLCILAAPLGAWAQTYNPNYTDLSPVMQAAKNLPPDVARAVTAAFPRNLLYKVVPTGEGSPRHPYQICATMVSAGEDGDPDLVAAAFNGRDTEIAMLAYSGGKANIIDTLPSKSSWFPSGDCTARTIDLANPLDSDDSNLAHAIKVSFEGADWYFLWEGHKLVDPEKVDFRRLGTGWAGWLAR